MSSQLGLCRNLHAMLPNHTLARVCTCSLRIPAHSGLCMQLHSHAGCPLCVPQAPTLTVPDSFLSRYTESHVHYTVLILAAMGTQFPMPHTLTSADACIHMTIEIFYPQRAPALSRPLTLSLFCRHLQLHAHCPSLDSAARLLLSGLRKHL